jgi:hypothetical protein
MDKDTMINALVKDYEDYLNDFTVDELQLIVGNGVFTLREAKIIIQKGETK